MIVELRSLSEIKPYDNNPRDNDAAVDAVAASIKEFGFRAPIIVDADFVIIVGHTRWKAAKKLGLDRVPVHIATELTPAQAKAYRIADNKTGELADWDFTKLPLELHPAPASSGRRAVEIHDDAKAEKNAPSATPAAASSPTPVVRKGRAWRWASVADVAAELGVAGKFVEKLVKEGAAEEAAGKSNPVPKNERNGTWQVQPGAVYAWALARMKYGISTRRPKGLVEPAGFAEVEEVQDSAGKGGDVSASIDTTEGILKLVIEKKLTIEQAKIALAEKEADRRAVDSAERRQAKVSREDVIKMLRSSLEVYCAVIEASAAARATAIVRTVRDLIGVELLEENAGAIQIIAAAECRFSNEHEIRAMQDNVRDQVDGVLLLEGTA